MAFSLLNDSLLQIISKILGSSYGYFVDHQAILIQYKTILTRSARPARIGTGGQSEPLATLGHSPWFCSELHKHNFCEIKVKY